jgi:hypothetical protein
MSSITGVDFAARHPSRHGAAVCVWLLSQGDSHPLTFSPSKGQPERAGVGTVEGVHDPEHQRTAEGVAVRRACVIYPSTIARVGPMSSSCSTSYNHEGADHICWNDVNNGV